MDDKIPVEEVIYNVQDKNTRKALYELLKRIVSLEEKVPDNEEYP